MQKKQTIKDMFNNKMFGSGLLAMMRCVSKTGTIITGR